MEVKFLEDWNTKEEIWYCDRFAQLSEESSTCGGFQNGNGSHVVHDDLIGLGGHKVMMVMIALMVMMVMMVMMIMAST